jgi:gas vesicle protein
MARKKRGRFGSFIFGGLVGFISGLAFAPRSGEETRELWKDKSEDLKEKMDELKKKAQELLEKLEETWTESEGLREQAFEKAVEFKMKAEELGRRATREAEHFGDDMKEKFGDLGDKLKGIQEDIEQAATDAGDEGAIKAGAALSALKEKLQDASKSFKAVMKAKEAELRSRVDLAQEEKARGGVEAEDEGAAETTEEPPAEKKTAKKTAAKKDSGAD